MLSRARPDQSRRRDLVADAVTERSVAVWTAGYHWGQSSAGENRGTCHGCREWARPGHGERRDQGAVPGKGTKG